MKNLLLFLMLLGSTLCGLAQTPDANGVLYVKPIATGDGSGNSWANAMGSVADALAAAGNNGNGITQIWVAAGTYQPALDANFSMVEGVSMYGHFAGVETAISERNLPDNNLETKLKGNGNRVLYNNGNGLTTATVLDGFTVTGGDVGGMYNYYSSPAIINCIFSGNSIDFGYGGGLYNEFSSPAISNCVFSGNSIEFGGGGGIYNKSSSPAISNCVFSGNSVSGGTGGGGMVNESSSPAIINCVFSGNSVNNGTGGGMYNESSSPVISNCVFSGNSLSGFYEDYGGGIYSSTVGSEAWNSRDLKSRPH